ncbi:hypothetical protein DLJ53_26830 [Acuticoccus sediminis]|uniref:Uncharacterized protein n=1 Tax=Acuticoccus sediminis TaxID=2184697 RepID=A0A8B2NQM8_9HYPH|nr:hypothetical protein [Acuticoccus sediminis]RAH98325.1 hypothetical protein DLJ53_26830 [Acuticoccus sediminis]
MKVVDDDLTLDHPEPYFGLEILPDAVVRRIAFSSFDDGMFWLYSGGDHSLTYCDISFGDPEPPKGH